MTFSSASAVSKKFRSSVGELFFNRVSELGCRTFLKIQRRGSFEDVSWRDVGAMVQNTLLGLHELGLAQPEKGSFKCADGSNINPGTIEALLESDSLIRQAVLVGDHRPFIAALIVPERGRIAAALDRM